MNKFVDYSSTIKELINNNDFEKNGIKLKLKDSKINEFSKRMADIIKDKKAEFILEAFKNKKDIIITSKFLDQFMKIDIKLIFEEAIYRETLKEFYENENLIYEEEYKKNLIILTNNTIYLIKFVRDILYERYKNEDYKDGFSLRNTKKLIDFLITIIQQDAKITNEEFKAYIDEIISDMKLTLSTFEDPEKFKILYFNMKLNEDQNIIESFINSNPAIDVLLPKRLIA